MLGGRCVAVSRGVSFGFADFVRLTVFGVRVNLGFVGVCGIGGGVFFFY